MKLFKYFFTILVGVSLVACDIDYEFTDSVPVEGDQGGSSQTAAELLNSAYNQLGSVFHGQTDTYALTEHSSDEMIGPTRGTDWSDNGIWRSLHAHNWDPTHQYVVDAWNDLNRGVFRTIEALAANPNPQQAAEAKFVRAYYMFHLVDLFGQVPIREADDGPDVDPRVLTRTEATNLVIQDLEQAIPDLPEFSDVGRASKPAARAFLAKVLLNKAVFTASNPAGPYDFAAADMDRVIELTDAVTGFQLATNYFDNFIPMNAETSPELIFTVPNRRGQLVGGGDGPHNRVFMTLHYNQNPSGWNGFTTLGNFYDQFAEGDQRRGGPLDGLTDVSGLNAGFLIGQQFDANGNPLKDRPGNDLVFSRDIDLAGNDERKGIRVIKYIPDYENTNAGENDYVLIRYADVLLMKAEAYLRKGDAATALSIVNDLRSVRGAQPLASLDEAELLAERGRELYWEGWRRNDQVRFGNFLSAWENKAASPDFRALFPIPQQAIDTNPNLQQNPGY